MDDGDAFAKSVAHMQVLGTVLARLGSREHSVAELVSLAPELICEFGFHRGLISRVTDGVWYPELMYVIGDPDWGAELTRTGKAAPQVLAPGLHETELVRGRKPILITDAQRQDETRWGHPGLVAASRTLSYVGVPIIVNDCVVGILHGDRYGSERDVDELDLDLLVTFAEAFQLALARAALAERMATADALLDRLGQVCTDLTSRPREPFIVRIAREPDESAAGLLVRSGIRVPRPLPGTLTARELEVLGLMAVGSTNLAIAEELFISDGTVKQHVTHILRKLGASNRSEAVVRWFQAGADANT